MGWRFAQISDVHLGVKLPGVSDEITNALRSAMRDSIVSTFRLAHEKGCQAVLIPGDLFDIKGQDPAGQLRFVYENAADYPTMRFFIAPGNSDAFSSNCPYALVRPPQNVTLFVSQDWETFECDGVTVTARAVQSGEGMLRLDWDLLPEPDPDRMSVLLLHGMLHGADDGWSKRLTIMPISPNDILVSRYSYVALGHMHAKIELRRGANHAAAAYAGPPQCLGFDERGPGGVLVGSLYPDGAELAFHSMCKYTWSQRHIVLPAPWVENYRTQLLAAYEAVTRELQPSDILQLGMEGEFPEARREELTSLLETARQRVFQVEADTSRVQFYSGIDPLSIPEGSLLSEFLRRCSAESAQPGSDQSTYELVRRLGWRLFSGQGLPAEVTP